MVHATSPHEHEGAPCGAQVWYASARRHCEWDFLIPNPGPGFWEHDYRKQPIKKKKNHVLFCSVLSDLLKTNVPETCCVCRKKRESISGSLTWIMFGVLCELITIGQCLPEQYYSVKKKKKKKTCKSSIVFLPDISYPVWEVKSCWL